MCLPLILLLVGIVSSKNVPPHTRSGDGLVKSLTPEMVKAFSSWSFVSQYNIWEVSGQFEGDIILSATGRNVISNSQHLWSDGVVIYYIKEEDFDEHEKEVIFEAIKNIEEKTCIRFQPFKEGDPAYVIVKGDEQGCWSFVGRPSNGQELNLGENCVSHGIVVHELLHALGLYHQQSSHIRDEYVTINWGNIMEGAEHNFNKMESNTVTDHGVGYDYSSIMHYSAYAFSKNEEKTITPKKEGAKIGTSDALSEKDIQKLNAMYDC